MKKLSINGWNKWLKVSILYKDHFNSLLELENKMMHDLKK